MLKQGQVLNIRWVGPEEDIARVTFVNREGKIRYRSVYANKGDRMWMCCGMDENFYGDKEGVVRAFIEKYGEG